MDSFPTGHNRSTRKGTKEKKHFNLSVFFLSPVLCLFHGVAFLLGKEFFGHDSCILINCRFSICFTNVCVEHGKVRLMWPQEKRTGLEGRSLLYSQVSERESLRAPQGHRGKHEWRQETEVLRAFRSQPLLGFLWERQGRLNNLRLASLINLGRI